jgi:RNA polymerase sigma-70 factor (ECF subfamily)
VVVSPDRPLEQVSVPSGIDPESAGWLEALADTGRRRECALADLYAMLLRAARRELGRRGLYEQITGPELDDLAHQAAGDGLLAITQKIGQFRGKSRFTTWAYKFAVFGVSACIGRQFWRNRVGSLDAEDWDQLPDRFGLDPELESECRDLVAAVRGAVEAELTPRQREVFVAIVVNGVPLDALVLKLGSNRNAIYKTMFDARRKLRAALVAKGYLNCEKSRNS